MAKKEIDCPHCSGKITLKPKETKEVTVDYFETPATTAGAPGIVASPTAGSGTTQILVPPPTKEEEKPRKLKHEELEEIIPTNYGKCPGGDCGHQKIKAKNQATKFKVCSNDKCESNSVRKDQPCPTCGKDFDEDSWKDLEDGVDLTEDEDGD